jgi:para-nitrobenzyl esterase
LEKHKISAMMFQKKQSFSSLLVGAAVAAMSVLPGVAQTPVTLNLSNEASVVGMSQDGVDAFLGIQYGLVGERFSRSSVLDIAEGSVVNATAYGPNCHQSYPGLPDFLHQKRHEEEECLYLNVWRPNHDPSKKAEPLSVMVWIHGGGFIVGSGADQQSNGANLARDQNVMVVTLNYRLGALGSLPQDEAATGAMNGLWDQLQALEWLQRYVEQLGGNPDEITMFGESSGGESICMLSVSPLAKGLFKRAILQSGECINNPWMLGVPNEDIDFARQAVENLLNATGVASVEELKNSSLVDPSSLNMISAGLGWSLVVLDREILPRHPRELYLNASNIVPVDMIIGANANEDLTFWGVTPDVYLQLADDGFNQSAYDLVGTRYGSEVARDALGAYDADIYYHGDTVLAYSQFHGDWYIRCPSRAFASRVANVLAEGHVYLYNFAHFAVTDPVVHFGLAPLVNTSTWASHMAEIPFVFGTLDFWVPSSASTGVTDHDIAVSQEMMARWANFAKSGNPNVNATSASTTWEPVPTSDVVADTSLASRSANGGKLPALVFSFGASQMVSDPTKQKQCAAFPFGEQAPLENGGGSDNNTGGTGDSSSAVSFFTATSFRWVITTLVLLVVPL